MVFKGTFTPAGPFVKSRAKTIPFGLFVIWLVLTLQIIKPKKPEKRRQETLNHPSVRASSNHKNHPSADNTALNKRPANYR